MTTVHLQVLVINNIIHMNKLIIKSLVAILFCSNLLCNAHGIELGSYTDEQALSEVSEQITMLSSEDRVIIAKDIYESKRSTLILNVIGMPSLPIEKVIIDAPSSNFRDQLAVQVLRADHLWTIPLIHGSSGVGSLYQRSLAVCDAIVTPNYKEGEIDWTGPLTRERRIQIATSFEEIIAIKYKTEAKSDPHQDEKSQYPLTEERTDNKKLQDSTSPHEQTNNLFSLRIFTLAVAAFALAITFVVVRRHFK